MAKLKIKLASIYKPAARSKRHHPYLIAVGKGASRKIVTGSTDLDATIEMAARLGRDHERVSLGLSSREEVRWSEQDRKPLAKHLDDYRLHLIATGRDPKHVRQMHDLARNVLLGTPPAKPAPKRMRGSLSKVKLDGTGARYVSQILPSLVQREIAKAHQQSGAATANRHLEAVNGFLNWGVSDTRWERNVVSHLPKYNKEADRRRVRRAAEVETFAKLLEVTATQPRRGGLTGAERVLLYRFVVASGLRRKEVRSLKVSDLVIAGPVVGVKVRAKIAKNQKSSLLGLPPLLVAELQQQSKGKAPDARLLACPTNTARMLRGDLKAAEIPYKDEQGHVFDFHAIRHSTGAMMLAAGADLQSVRHHMRHGSIKLTGDTYGHLLDSQREQAAKAVPNFSAPGAAPTLPSDTKTFPNVPVDAGKTGEMAGKSMEPRGIEPRFAECDSAVDIRKVCISRGLRKGKNGRVAPGAARRAARKIRAAVIYMRRNGGRSTFEVVREGVGR